MHNSIEIHRSTDEQAQAGVRFNQETGRLPQALAG